MHIMQSPTNRLTFIVMRAILTSVSFYLGEFLTKLLFVNSAATGVRWIIDKLFA